VTYPKIIERPYKVYHGYPDDSYTSGVYWEHDKSFELESDAEAYANRIAEDYEFVKIEKKETDT
jgi:hypothetical protein